MRFLSYFLELFGIGWLILIIILGIFGGKIKIQLKNPFTKKLDTIISITIDKENNIDTK